MKQIFAKFNTLLTIFIGITILGTLVYYLLGEDSSLWKLLSVLDTSSAIALAVLAFFGYLEFIRSEQTIKIYFECDGKHIDTKLSTLRKDCTRGEILGILGMIQKDPKKRFEINYSKSPDMLTILQEVQKGTQDKFIIPVSTEELEQFAIEENS